TEEQLIGEVIRVAESVLQFQACSIFLLDPATDTFVLRGTTGALRDRVGKLGYARGEGFTGWVSEVGKPILLNDPRHDNRWRGKYVEIPSEEVSSFLAVPILSRGGSIGAIRVLRRNTGHPLLDNTFKDDDLRLLQAISDQISSALENMRNIEKIVSSERMIAWGELSAKSSHMIGNRVFALKGDVNELLHLLHGECVDVADLRALQLSLQTNVSRLEEILQDFRDFVTATKLSKESIDLNSLVEEAVHEVFPKRSEVLLRVSTGELPPVEVDSKKIRRAIGELVENSLSHMLQGRLSVATSVVSGNAYPQTIRKRIKRYASIVIEDSGPGVDPELKAKIFQPFFTGRARGMGLGLSIVRGIVDAHGGEVFEEGEKGKGARFVILLPIAEE
ncbi:MAG TPA: ATP-binding protein, partial [Fimbriimonas sp.]|nr:ATP-binding protein [Fimbriimonas sp.]